MKIKNHNFTKFSSNLYTFILINFNKFIKMEYLSICLYSYTSYVHLVYYVLHVFKHNLKICNITEENICYKTMCPNSPVFLFYRVPTGSHTSLHFFFSLRLWCLQTIVIAVCDDWRLTVGAVLLSWRAHVAQHKVVARPQSDAAIALFTYHTLGGRLQIQHLKIG